MACRRKKHFVRRFGKYIFLLVVAVVCFVFGIIYLDIVDFTLLGDNFSDPSIDEKFSLEILRDDVTICLTKLKQASLPEKTVSETGDTINPDKESLVYGSEDVFSVLTSFNNLLSLLDIKSVIIEPSILYCMLLPKYQDLLLKRHFNVSHFSGSKDIITYGILERDVAILQNEGNIYRFTNLGFQPYFVQAPLAEWMKLRTTRFEFDTFSSHIFYKHKHYTFHLVVFHERASYLWHAALDSQSDKIPDRDKLVFIENDAAYEKFSFVALEDKILPVADFFVPTNVHYFLFEMLSSRFLECDLSRASNVVSETHPKAHPGMSVERFNRRTRYVLRELKKIFHPLLMNLWIWSGTMLGWYRQCDIIPYTTDVDFASWASEVEDLDAIINMLLNNKYAAIKTRMGILDEALEFQISCLSLRTDVFFMYRIQNGSWCSGHSPKLGYYFRYFYPPFTICSAELLEEKVQVPCETENVIKSEYGPNWSKPVSSWHYETSIINRGPNIYWEKNKLKTAYQNY